MSLSVPTERSAGARSGGSGRKIRGACRSDAGRRGEPGFTLIEVLVVTAVIALLAAVLLPALGRARAQSRALVCATRLKTCGMAVVYYAEAYRGVVVPSGAWAERCAPFVQRLGARALTGGDAEPAGSDAVPQYVESYLCPDDPVRARTYEIRRPFDGQIRRITYRVSYAFNACLSFPPARPEAARRGEDYTLDRYLLDARGRPLTDANGDVVYRLRSFAQVRRTSDIVVLTDAGDDDVGPGGPPEWGQPLDWDFDEEEDNFETDPRDSPGRLEVHHRSGNQFLFADQHVSFEKVMMGRVPQNGVPRFPRHWMPLERLAPPAP